MTKATIDWDGVGFIDVLFSASIDDNLEPTIRVHQAVFRDTGLVIPHAEAGWIEMELYYAAKLLKTDSNLSGIGPRLETIPARNLQAYVEREIAENVR